MAVKNWNDHRLPTSSRADLPVNARETCECVAKRSKVEALSNRKGAGVVDELLNNGATSDSLDAWHLRQSAHNLRAATLVLPVAWIVQSMGTGVGASLWSTQA